MSLGRRFLAFSILALTFAALSSPALAACGDGVINPGEGCDDGSQNGTTNSCCNTSCQLNGNAPDVIVGELVGTMRWGTLGGISAYSIGTTSCNIGSCWLNWINNTAEHPVIGQNMFRLKDGRFEQIGQAWLKHGFTALAENACSASCVAPPNGSHLGVNCSDPYDQNLNGSQGRLGPKVDVNPYNGVYLFPDSRINTTGNAIFKRLQIHDVDINPALNAGALYFAEGQYVTHDDSTAKMNTNNASYRTATFTGTTTFTLALTGTTQRQKAAVQAWKAADPGVTETTVPGPEGMFILAAKATSLGGGLWHYEYALQNLTNHRAAQSFVVPLQPGTTVTNVGFHDVDYHSGEPFDGTDWTPTVASNSITWATQTFATNPNANALRWGTLYNFRFDANVAPGSANATINLFKLSAQNFALVTTVTPGPCGGAPNGSACNDLNSCTQVDLCLANACLGTQPVTCTPIDACHDAGTCNTSTGACSTPSKPNGTACDDSSLCTQPDSCQAGVCTGSNPIICSPLDPCHDAGTCDPGTGSCSNPVSADGTPCSDANACTEADACAGGTCAPGTPVVCAPEDACHDAGTCDTGTGACSNPAKADGSPCDDANACTTDDACAGGVCTATGPGLPQDVGSTLLVSHAGGISTISWTPATDSSASSVLRGLVAQLPVGPGGSDELCLGSSVAESSIEDPEDPAPDQAFWYLVRGVSDCGTGSYGYEEHDGLATVPRQSATCP